MPDIRRMGATMLTYTGKVLNYILAVPPPPDDATSPLRLAIGNEASEADIREFAARFDCQVRDSYGSTEGIIIIRRDASMPRGALGRLTTHRGLRPRDRTGVPGGEFDADGRLINADAAIGEIVNTAPGAAFEGYYRNEEARRAKVRDGVYWSGDLAYRDADGWFYFAGRSNEWLRVDGENFAAGAGRAHRRCDIPTSVRRPSTPCPTTRSATGSWSRSRSPTSPPSTSALRRVPADPARSRAEMGAGFVRVDRRAPQAREHEDRQDQAPQRGVAQRRDVLACASRRTAAADERRRPGASCAAARPEPESR